MAWRGEHEQQLDECLSKPALSKGEDLLAGYTSGEDDNASSLSISDDESLEDTDEDEEGEDDFGAWTYPHTGTTRRRASVATESSVIATIRLAAEVEELRRRRYELQSLQLSRLLNSDRRDQLLTTALEYFDTFRMGFHSPRLPDIMQYLNSRIDHNLFSYGGSNTHGTSTLIEQWRRYTRMLPSISIRVRSTNCTNFIDPRDHDQFEASAMDPTITTCMVETHGTLSGLISKHAIRTILPHLEHRLDLTHKLLNKELDCPISLALLLQRPRPRNSP